MKKLFAISLLLTAFIVSTNAYSQTLAIGIEAGVNIANANITPSTTTTSSRTGFLVGGIVDIGFSPTFGITTGMRYVMKGFSFPGVTTTGIQVEATNKVSYLEFPVLLKVKFPLTEVKPYIIGGPTIGLKLAANQDFVGGGASGTSDISASTESIDFGLLFGAGMDFRVGPKMDLFVQGAYNLGISNVEKALNQVGTPSSTKTYGIQFTGGVKFRL